MSETTFTVELKRAESASDEERLVYGWAYVTDKGDGTAPLDTDGDVVDTPEAFAAFKRAFWSYFADHRTGDDMHVNFNVAELRDGIVFTPEVGRAVLTEQARKVLDAAGVTQPTPTGAFISLQIPHTENGDRVWHAVKSGERRMLSIVAAVEREALTNAA